MHRKVGLVALALISAFTVACAGPSAAAPASTKTGGGAQAMEVKATDMLKFEPATVTAKNGVPVRLTLANSGVLEHNWVVESLDGKRVEVEAKPKTSATGEFTPTTPGRYEVYCSVLGHREAGMTGTLVVQ